jgi:hypothetical protein
MLLDVPIGRIAIGEPSSGFASRIFATLAMVPSPPAATTRSPCLSSFASRSGPSSSVFHAIACGFDHRRQIFQRRLADSRRRIVHQDCFWHEV